MDKRTVTEFKLVIKNREKSKCAEIDPFGQCTVDECMQCPNACVQIVRQDGTVMRDDFIHDTNIKYENNRSLCKCLLQRDGVALIEDAFHCAGVELIEKIYDTKLTMLEKWILQRGLNRKKSCY